MEVEPSEKGPQEAPSLPALQGGYHTCKQPSTVPGK